jgi:hypothetical protein
MVHRIHRQARIHHANRANQGGKAFTEAAGTGGMSGANGTSGIAVAIVVRPSRGSARSGPRQSLFTLGRALGTYARGLRTGLPQAGLAGVFWPTSLANLARRGHSTNSVITRGGQMPMLNSPAAYAFDTSSERLPALSLFISALT